MTEYKKYTFIFMFAILNLHFVLALIESREGTDSDALYCKIAEKYKESMNDMQGRSAGDFFFKSPIFTKLSMRYVKVII